MIEYTEQQKNDYIYGMMLELHSQYKENNTIYYRYYGMRGSAAELGILNQYCKQFNCKLIIVANLSHFPFTGIKALAPMAKIRLFKRKKWEYFDVERASIKVASIIKVPEDYSIRCEISKYYLKEISHV